MEVPSNKTTSVTNKIKTYLPYILLFALTVGLMAFFKHNKRNLGSMIKAGTSDLLLLAQNLKPLLFHTEINDEDVFNFALYQSLPLDKEKNKVLLLSTNEQGNNIYEVKPAEYNPHTDNYATFVKYLNLNNDQKRKADSLLNNYKKEIYSSILVSDKNTIAINPRLSELRQAVLADLISFAQKVNAEKSYQLFEKNLKISGDKGITDLIASAKNIPQSDYILISPDTVTRTHFTWDSDKFSKHYNEWEKNKTLTYSPMIKLDNPDKQSSNNWSRGGNSHESDFSFKIDSNQFKIEIPVESINHITTSISDSIRIKLNEAAKEIRRISIPMPPGVRQERGIPKVPPVPGTGKSKSMKIVDPYGIVSSTMEMLSKQNWGELVNYGLKMDSLNKSHTRDTAAQRKLKESIYKMKKKLQRLQNFNGDSVQVR
jgi:hypothetical protein